MADDEYGEPMGFDGGEDYDMGMDVDTKLDRNPSGKTPGSPLFCKRAGRDPAVHSSSSTRLLEVVLGRGFASGGFRALHGG